MSESDGDFERNSEAEDDNQPVKIETPASISVPPMSPGDAVNSGLPTHKSPTAETESPSLIIPAPPSSQPPSPARPHHIDEAHYSHSSEKPSNEPTVIPAQNAYQPSVSFQGVPIPTFENTNEVNAHTAAQGGPSVIMRDEILNPDQFKELFQKGIGAAPTSTNAAVATTSVSNARSYASANRSAIGPAARLRLATRENLRSMSPGALPAAATFIDPFRGSKFKNRIFLNSQGNGTLVLSGGRPTTASAAVLAGSVKKGDQHIKRSVSASVLKAPAASSVAPVSHVTESQRWSPVRSTVESSRGGLGAARGAVERALDRESALQVALVNLRHDMEVKEKELLEMRVKTKQAQESMSRTEATMIRSRPTEADALTSLLDHLRNKNAHQETKIGLLEEQVYQLKQNTRAARAGELQVQCTAYLAEIRRLTDLLSSKRGGQVLKSQNKRIEGGAVIGSETPLHLGDDLSTPVVDNLILAIQNEGALTQRGSRTNSPVQQRPATSQSEPSHRQRDIQIEGLHKRLLSAKEDYRLAEAEAEKWKTLYNTEKPQMDEAVRRLELFKEFPKEVKRLSEEIISWKDKLSVAEELLEKEKAARVLEQQSAQLVVVERNDLAQQVKERDFKLQQQEERFERRGKELDAEVIVKVATAVDAEKAIAREREAELLKELGEWNIKLKAQVDFAVRQKSDFESTLEKLKLQEEHNLTALKNTLRTEEHEREAKLRKTFEETEAALRRQLEYQQKEAELASQKLNLSQQEAEKDKVRAQELERRLLASQETVTNLTKEMDTLKESLTAANVAVANANAAAATATAAAARSVAITPPPPPQLAPSSPAGMIPANTITRHGSFQPPTGLDFNPKSNALLHVVPPQDHVSQARKQTSQESSSVTTAFSLASGTPGSPLSPPQGGIVAPAPPAALVTPNESKVAVEAPLVANPSPMAPILTTSPTTTVNGTFKDDVETPRGGGFLAQSEMLIGKGLPQPLTKEGGDANSSMSINQTVVDVGAVLAAPPPDRRPVSSQSPPIEILPVSVSSSNASPMNAQSPDELGTTSKPNYSPNDLPPPPPPPPPPVATAAPSGTDQPNTPHPPSSTPLTVDKGRYGSAVESALNQMSGSIEDRRESSTADGAVEGAYGSAAVSITQQPERLKLARPGVAIRRSPSSSSSSQKPSVDADDSQSPTADGALSALMDHANESSTNNYNTHNLNSASAGTSVSSSTIQHRPLIGSDYIPANRAGSMRLIPGADAPSPLATYSAFSHDTTPQTDKIIQEGTTPSHQAEVRSSLIGARNGDISLKSAAFGSVVESEVLTGSTIIPPTPLQGNAAPPLSLPQDHSHGSAPGVHIDSARPSAGVATAAPTPRLQSGISSSKPAEALAPLTVSVPLPAPIIQHGGADLSTSNPNMRTTSSIEGGTGDIPLPKPLPAHEMIPLGALNPKALASAQNQVPDATYPHIPKTQSLSVSSDDGVHARAGEQRSIDSSGPSPFRDDTNTATYHNEPSPIKSDFNSNTQTPNFPNSSAKPNNGLPTPPVQLAASIPRSDSLTADLQTSADMIESTTSFPSASASATTGNKAPESAKLSPPPASNQQAAAAPTTAVPMPMEGALSSSPTSRSPSVPPSALKGASGAVSTSTEFIRKSVSFPVNAEIEVHNTQQWTESSQSSSSTGSSSTSTGSSSDTTDSSNSSTPQKNRETQKEKDRFPTDDGAVRAPKTAEEEL